MVVVFVIVGVGSVDVEHSSDRAIVTTGYTLPSVPRRDRRSLERCVAGWLGGDYTSASRASVWE